MNVGDILQKNPAVKTDLPRLCITDIRPSRQARNQIYDY